MKGFHRNIPLQLPNKRFRQPFSTLCNHFIQTFRDICFFLFHADQVVAYGASYWSMASLKHEITALIELFSSV